MSHHQPKWLRPWQWFGVSGAIAYILGLGIAFWLYFPISSGVFHVGERIGNVIFKSHTWLIDRGFGQALNVAGHVADTCYILGPLIAIPALSILGIRLLFLDGTSRRGAALLATGIGISVIAVVIPVVVFRFYANGLASLKEQNTIAAASLRKQLDRKDLNPKMRQLAWKSYASSIYSLTGENIPIPSESGKDLPYQPPEWERNMREKGLELEDRLEHPLGNLVFWGGYLLLSVLVGVYMAFSLGKPGGQMTT